MTCSRDTQPAVLEEEQKSSGKYKAPATASKIRRPGVFPTL